MADNKAMIIRSRYRLPLVSADEETTYPVLQLMTGVLLPGSFVTIQVGRPENLQLLDEVYKNDADFVAAYSHTEMDTPGRPPLHQVGVFAKVRDIRSGTGKGKVVTIEGLSRAAISRIVDTEPYLKVVASAVANLPFVKKTVTSKINDVISIVSEITQLDPIYSPELANVLRMYNDDPSVLADLVASNIHLSLSAKQELLEAVALEERLERLLFYLNGELNRAATERSIEGKVKQQIESDQRKHYLRQQLHQIRKQLGEDFSEEKEAARWRNHVKSNPQFPHEVTDRALMEIDRLTQLSSASAEFGATKSYLDWLLHLPWGRCRPDDYQIPDVEKVLSKGYFGPQSIKERILQRLSVRKLLGGKDQGSTLCLVGAPGTGKASLAKAIARAMGKEFIRISVGGITEVDEIKGSPRTYLGAYPGKIIRTLRDADSCDPLILIEDIDYFNIDNDSSVNMSLLEVIDARYNNRFLDSYLGVPFDLSKVIFVCSVRAFEDIPEQFLPRLELLELPGYIAREKIVIAKHYILPNMLKRHGLTRTECRITDKALGIVISNYTQEAGLLGFSQQIERIFRKIALEKAEKTAAKWSITDKNIEDYLGTPIFIPEKAETDPEIGIAAGLAWTGAGGELMFIEGLKMKGEGQIITTGSLGEVMRESIQAAHSYVRSKSDVLGIDFNDFREFDIHIHFPSGAIPKDGPSAGITVSLVIASVMSERPIRNDVAMTGEVTLRGKILPVGGVKEKVSAAFRAGIFEVVLPRQNEKDLKDLPKEIIRKTKFHFIDRVDELFDICLLDFQPSAFTLEKIFAEEIERARNEAAEGAASKPKRSSKKKVTRKKPAAKKSAAKKKSPGKPASE